MKKHVMRSLLSSVKVILSVTLLAILVNFSAAAKSDSEPSPEGFITDGVYYRIISAEDKTVEMANPRRNKEFRNKELKYEKNFVVPAKVVWQDTEYSVTSIGNDAFPDSIVIESVTLPATVDRVHYGSFNGDKKLANIIVSKDNPKYCDVDGVLFSKDMTELEIFPEGKVAEVYEVPASVIKLSGFIGCRYVQKILLPSDVTSIGSFIGCTSLKDIVVDSSNKNYRSIDGALYNTNATTLISFPPAKNADSYSFPESLTIIEEGAFDSYQASTQLVLPPTVISFGDGWRSAFADGSSLECITIPASVTYVNGEAFDNCSALREINVDKSNPYFTSVDGVLYNKDMSSIFKCPQCYPDTIFKVPEGISIIDEWAFSECKNITTIQLPESLSEIRGQAFAECSLRSLVIPDSVKIIGDQAFRDCPELTTITIGASVKLVGHDIFGDRSNNSINKVICLPAVPPVLNEDLSSPIVIVDAFLRHTTYESIYEAAVLYVPAGCKEAYSSVEPWNKFQNIQELEPAK